MAHVPAAYRGTLHHFTSRLTAFEHTPNRTQSNVHATIHNTILFLGGLGDGLMHPHYPSTLAAKLPPTWSIAEVLLSSSYSGWATSSLAKDATELARAVSYFRSLPGRAAGSGRIVLMGHSTGSQICMEYLVGPWRERVIPSSTIQRPAVDGIILQAGISDREGVLASNKFDEESLERSRVMAREWVANGRGEDVLSESVTKREFGRSMCARRWLSLVEGDGDDDYFSSDLGDDRIVRTFGMLGARGVPILVLLSEKDENMPEHVDKTKLLERWSGAVEAGRGHWHRSSGVVSKATHNYNRSEETVVRDLCERVVAFISTVNTHGGGKGDGKSEQHEKL